MLPILGSRATAHPSNKRTKGRQFGSNGGKMNIPEWSGAAMTKGARYSWRPSVSASAA
jgi:hypothetical protein